MATGGMIEDGELESSSDEEQEVGNCNKKIRLEEEEEEDQQKEPSEQDGKKEEWFVVVKGPKKRTASSEPQANKKKKRKRKSRSYNHDVLDQTTPPVPISEAPNVYLNQHQKNLLQLLSTLTGGTSQAPKETAQYKTADFQAVIRYLVSGVPQLSKKAKCIRANPLRDKKVLIVWLSCVSREDFTHSETCFQGLKSLTLPSVQFPLTHPGSDKFVHFGLESFMEIDDQSKQRALPEKFKMSPLEFSRRHCLLDYEQLLANEYPVPPQPQSEETDTHTDQPVSDYVMLGTWPVQIDGEVVCAYPLFAVDCEMVQTQEGSELARVSIINEDLECIYSSLVKPANPVLDYLTKFSGVDEAMLQDVQVTLKDVQVKMAELLPPNCILVGHSLENDLAALKLHHPYVIDTSLLFAPHATPRSKPKLRTLAKRLLSKDIQCSSSGHDPTEDARTCMELVKRKLEEGPKFVIQWNEYKTWLPSHLSSHGVNAAVIDKQSISYIYCNHTDASPYVVSSDEEAVQKTVEYLPKLDFVFVQLHAMEVFKREEKERKTEEQLVETLSLLDGLSCRMIEESPVGTLVFVVCGSSYIKEVRRLQKDPKTDSETLKAAVMAAREGTVLAVLK